jgi:hypothetical protein
MANITFGNWRRGNGVVTNAELLKRVRATLPLYLVPDVTAHTGIHLRELQQIIAGTFKPTPVQLNALARRLHLLDKVR